jgi:hypothetical protein
VSISSKFSSQFSSPGDLRHFCSSSLYPAIIASGHAFQPKHCSLVLAALAKDAKDGKALEAAEAVAEAMVKAIWRAGDGIFAGCFAGILMLFFRESLMCCFSSCCFGLCMSMYYLMNLMRFRGKSTLKLTTHIKHKHKSTAHACTNHPLLIGPVFVVSWFSQLNSRNMVGDTICYYLISIQ